MTYNQREKLKMFSVACIALGLLILACYVMDYVLG